MCKLKNNTHCIYWLNGSGFSCLAWGVTTATVMISPHGQAVLALSSYWALFLVLLRMKYLENNAPMCDMTTA